MYLSVGRHRHKADPTGLQSRVKNDLRVMIWVYRNDTISVCDECPGITMIMSTQINLEQDWVFKWTC